MHYAQGLQDLLGYPNDPEHNALPCKYAVHEPLVNMDMASQVDTGVTLHRGITSLTEALATLKLNNVEASTQTFDRMVKLLTHANAMFKWCIPCPGEMHLTHHTVPGTFRLWWHTPPHNVSRSLSRPNLTKDWTLTNWNHQDMFMLVVCEAIRRWFCEVSAMTGWNSGRGWRHGPKTPTEHTLYSSLCSRMVSLSHPHEPHAHVPFRGASQHD